MGRNNQVCIPIRRDQVQQAQPQNVRAPQGNAYCGPAQCQGLQMPSVSVNQPLPDPTEAMKADYTLESLIDKKNIEVKGDQILLNVKVNIDDKDYPISSSAKYTYANGTNASEQQLVTLTPSADGKIYRNVLSSGSQQDTTVGYSINSDVRVDVDGKKVRDVNVVLQKGVTKFRVDIGGETYLVDRQAVLDYVARKNTSGLKPADPVAPSAVVPPTSDAPVVPSAVVPPTSDAPVVPSAVVPPTSDAPVDVLPIDPPAKSKASSEDDGSKGASAELTVEQKEMVVNVVKDVAGRLSSMFSAYFGGIKVKEVSGSETSIDTSVDPLPIDSPKGASGSAADVDTSVDPLPIDPAVSDKDTTATSDLDAPVIPPPPKDWADPDKGKTEDAAELDAGAGMSAELTAEQKEMFIEVAKDVGGSITNLFNTYVEGLKKGGTTDELPVAEPASDTTPTGDTLPTSDMLNEDQTKKDELDEKEDGGVPIPFDNL